MIKDYRADDLQAGGLRIYQDPEGYCFTSDAVILAHFCNAKKTTRAVDLGSGSGIIAILLTGKYNAAYCAGIEIQKKLADMSAESVRLNGLSDKMQIYNAPMQEAGKLFTKHRFDLAVCNPPYTKAGDGEVNSDGLIAVCRHEIAVTLKEVIKAAADMIKYGGRFCMIHQTERMAEVFAELEARGLKPKRLRLVEGRTGLAPALFMVEARSGAAHGLKIERTLTLYDNSGAETEELKKIYGRTALY